MDLTPAALIIFLSTIAISLYTIYKDHSLLYRLMFSPYELSRQNKWYTLITSGFVHADLSHLMFNMFTFYFFAFSLESAIGSAKFLIIYFGSLILSDVGSYFKHKDNPDYRSLGASGAISGILFSAILYFPSSKLMIFPIPVPIPAPIFGLLYLAWCFYASKNQHDRINHSAHFIGALVGIVITLALDFSVAGHFLEYLGL